MIDRNPTPDEHAHNARAHLSAAGRTAAEAAALEPSAPPYLYARTTTNAQLRALLGIGEALLAVAGEAEASRQARP